MKRKVLRRLRRRGGESLAEALAALLIATLGLTMLPGALVAAARVNREAEKQYVRVRQTEAKKVEGAVVTLSLGAAAADTLSVTVYCDDLTPESGQRGYYYYEYNDGAE